MAKDGERAGSASPVTAAPQRVDPVEPGTQSQPRAVSRHSLCVRALLIWPGLDRTQLSRTQGDPHKVARLVARRTIHSEEAILSLLEGS